MNRRHDKVAVAKKSPEHELGAGSSEEFLFTFTWL